MRVKQDYDDGKLEYEVEFYVGGQEYDYKLMQLALFLDMITV